MVDLLITNVMIADVITQQTYRGWLSVKEGRFFEVEAGDVPDDVSAKTHLDAGGKTVRPGLIDTHMHIESSLLTPRRFAEAVLPWGTTTILQDPHEVANVLGADGIRWMIEASQGVHLRIFSAISSCVPATAEHIETPNAKLEPADVLALAKEPGVLALGEMMDYHGVIEGDKQRLAILQAGKDAALSLEGHVPSLTGRDLSHYIAQGMRSNHNLMTPAKLTEQLRKGLYVMLQEKSLTADVIDTVMNLPERSRVLLITDDVMPNRLRHGHMSRILDIATSLGWKPLDALASATLRPASYLGLRHVGAIVPGYLADFFISGDTMFPPERVYVAGTCVAERGELTVDLPATPQRPALTTTSFVNTDLPSDFFRLSDEPQVRANVIRVNDSNTFTTLETRDITLKDGVPQADDIVMGVVIARDTLQHPLPERGALTLVAGLGLSKGAYASTFAHDSHNVFVLGKSAAAMRQAARAVLARGGGMAVVPEEDATPLLLPLPYAGLLSDEAIGVVGEQFEVLEQTLRQLGVNVKNPILLLTILPLTVSPEYKISDKGLVDVEKRQVIASIT
jgi:adenine deaminase